MSSVAERWVNAVCTYLIPLEVSPDAPDPEKLDAAVEAWEKEMEDAGSGYVTTIGFEDCDSDEPPTNPARELQALQLAGYLVVVLIVLSGIENFG